MRTIGKMRQLMPLMSFKEMTKEYRMLGFVSRLQGLRRNVPDKCAPVAISVDGWKEIVPHCFVAPLEQKCADVCLNLLADNTGECDLRKLGWVFAKDNSYYFNRFQLDISSFNSSIDSLDWHPLDYASTHREIMQTVATSPFVLKSNVILKDCPQIRGIAWIALVDLPSDNEV